MSYLYGFPTTKAEHADQRANCATLSGFSNFKVSFFFSATVLQVVSEKIRNRFDVFIILKVNNDYL
jgi:hypothetical protein